MDCASDFQPTNQQPPRRNPTVLVAEDEWLIRSLMVTMLRNRGVEVLEARDGEAAYEICSDPSQRIDLLITDEGMPLMKGMN